MVPRPRPHNPYAGDQTIDLLAEGLPPDVGEDEDEPKLECLFEFCLRHLSEEKLFEFLQALIRGNGRFPDTTRNGESFLSVALEHWKVLPSNVLLLLCRPGVTRLTASSGGSPPLHIACKEVEENSVVIARLIDLDPGVLMIRGRDAEVPLHPALNSISEVPDVVARMVEERPEALLCRDRFGQTPVESAVWGSLVSPQLASALQTMVKLRPASVVFHPMDRFKQTALHHACERFNQHPDLIEEIVRAHPPALCIASTSGPRNEFELPFEAIPWPPGSVVPAFVATETLHQALAVVEYVTGEVAFSHDEQDVVWFQFHVLERLEVFLPAPVAAGTAGGFAVARAMSKLENVMDLVRAIFCHDRVRDLLRLNEGFRDTVLGEAVVDLYRLNRRGRFEDDDLTAADQVDLLVSLQESGTVESTYLHFREVARHVLLSHGVANEASRSET